jgi:hypothetical protein
MQAINFSAANRFKMLVSTRDCCCDVNAAVATGLHSRLLGDVQMACAPFSRLPFEPLAPHLQGSYLNMTGGSNVNAL